MASSDPRAHTGDDGAERPSWQTRRASESVAQSQSRRVNDESWIEIASQPSSSSLSSIGDEIVTTGLRVGGQTHPHRRRRAFQQHASAQIPPTNAVFPATAQAGTSSQEEYDETESDEDRLMTSSTENLPPRRPNLPAQQTAIGPTVDSESEDDYDDQATALGRPSSSPTFRPQPNAFSHPPSHLQHRSHSTNSSVPHYPHFHRPSMSQRSQTRVQRPNFMAYREDNEAALRASLTTLLSCAAAARALPKKDTATAGPSGSSTGIRPSNQPMDLRLVPESELLDKPSTSAAAHPALGIPARTASNSSAPSRPASTSSRDATSKTKRTASAAAAGQQAKPARAAKKKRTASSAPEAADGTALFSPSVLTWVVSAGVVVLVSVVGFGAGYVIGRETGYNEALAGGGFAGGGGGVAANASTSCGNEIARSSSGGTLRRFRWGAGMARSVAA